MTVKNCWGGREGRRLSAGSIPRSGDDFTPMADVIQKKLVKQNNEIRFLGGVSMVSRKGKPISPVMGRS
jgi:hypothetical protein